MDTETRASILAEARSWLGTPFHHKGRIKHVGVDCGGFIYEVYSKFFPLKPFPSSYAEDWALHRDNNEIYLDFIKDYVVEIAAPIPAGLVMFQVGRAFSHGTIYTERDTYIHAYGRTQMGAVIESHRSFFMDGEKRMRFAKFFDMKS